MEKLATQLGLSAAQVDGLSAQKKGIQSDREIVGDCMRLIKQLRARMAEHIHSSQRVTDELRRILEPSQVGCRAQALQLGSCEPLRHHCNSSLRATAWTLSVSWPIGST